MVRPIHVVTETRAEYEKRKTKNLWFLLKIGLISFAVLFVFLFIIEVENSVIWIVAIAIGIWIIWSRRKDRTRIQNWSNRNKGHRGRGNRRVQRRRWKQRQKYKRRKF